MLRISESSRKIAVIARIAGNIWIRTSEVSPARRPRKRIRLKAKAAEAPMNTEVNATTVAMITVFLNHTGNGR